MGCRCSTGTVGPDTTLASPVRRWSKKTMRHHPELQVKELPGEGRAKLVVLAGRWSEEAHDFLRNVSNDFFWKHFCTKLKTLSFFKKDWMKLKFCSN